MASKFQQRHYEAIAELFEQELDDLERNPDAGTTTQVNSYRAELDTFRKRVIRMFKEDNERFDEGRFIEASGGEREWWW